jgi:outer membrane receptor protein involved in Fe transport
MILRRVGNYSRRNFQKEQLKSADYFAWVWLLAAAVWRFFVKYHHKNLYCLSAMALAIASSFTPYGAHAQETDKKSNDSERLKEVEVVGTSPLPGIGIEEDKLPYDVQSINAEALYRSQSMNLTDFMSRNLSGVNINEVQGSPFQADITYRGFRLSGILGSPQGLSVYLDGVRVNEPFGDVINWDMIPEAAINNVTLVPGSNPIYGLNTLGGALAFTTKSGLTAPGTEVKLQAGSFGRMRADVAYGSKSDDGYHSFISSTGFREAGWRDYSSGQLGNVFAKVGRQQDDSKWDLSLLVGRSRLLGNGLLPSTNYGEDGDDHTSPGSHMYERNRRSVYTHPDRTQNELTMVNFNFQRFFENDTELAANAYVRQSSRKSVNGDYEIDDDEEVLNYTNTTQTSYGSNLNLTKLLDSHQITAGLSADFARMKYGAQQAQDCGFSSTRQVSTDCDIPAQHDAGVSGRSHAFGLYASDTWAVNERTFVTGSARFNHANVANIITRYTGGVGTDQPRESFNYNSLNPSVGLSFKASSMLTFFGNVGQSNRVPTVIELGCADSRPAYACRLPTGLQADPYLDQVIARTLDLGTRWRSDNTELTASLYRSENRNDILFVPTSATGLGYFDNFTRTRRQGLDLSLRTTVGPLALQASYNYLDATYQFDGRLFGGERDIEVKRGTRIAGLPDHSFRFLADWRTTEKLTVGGSVVMISSIVTQGNEDGKIVGDHDVDAKVKGYALFNMNMNYAADKGLDYFARINNVFDTRSETYGMIAMSAFDQSGASNLLSTNGEGTVNRFVAPGAPRNFMVGMRYRF